MNNNNTFLLLVKKELTDNRKPILLGLVGIWATFILLGGFLGYAGSYIAVEILLFIFFAGMLLSIGSSLAFSNMKSKEGRINTLMLPASVEQKFLVRWLAAVPILYLVVLFGCFLGDWTRLGVFRLMSSLNVYPVSTTPHGLLHEQSLSGLEYIRLNFEHEPQSIGFLIVTVFLIALLMQALYFFGAILWPKLSFIKTWAASQALEVVAGIIILMCAKLRFPTFNEAAITFVGFMWCYVGILLACCVALYWLAYVRFKRSQVIYKLF